MAGTFDQGLNNVIAQEPGIRDSLGQGQSFADMSEATRQLVAEGAAISLGDRSLLNSEAAKGFVSGTTFNSPSGGTVTPTPTTDATTQPYVDPAAGYGGDLTNLIEERYSGLFDGQLTEQEIQDQEMQRIQAQVDALNQIYTGRVNQANSEGQDRLGRGRSLNAISGTGWSPFGEARQQGIEVQNRKIVDAINAEKSQELANLYAAARGEVTRRVERQADKLSADTNNYVDQMVKAYGLSQDEANALRDNALRIAQITGTYNGEDTLDAQNQEFSQNMALREYLAQEEQRAIENNMANQELDLKVEAARQAGYQVDTMQDGTVGYWDYTSGVPKFTAIGNYAKLTGGGSGGGGGRGSSGYDDATETAALNAYFDTFGEFPAAKDYANVVNRYVSGGVPVPIDPTTAFGIGFGGGTPPMDYSGAFSAGRGSQLEYKGTSSSNYGGGGVAAPY